MRTLGYNQSVVLQVKYAADKRSVMVTTKASAPGGARTEKVGLPFDPDLFDHMVEHGVVVEVTGSLSPMQCNCIHISLAYKLVANRSITESVRLAAILCNTS